uniref:Uncharacterized protein n=1 Tax=Avena sativa TaxID=4498 RepID=A0ACD5W703_AVESA
MSRERRDSSGSSSSTSGTWTNECSTPFKFNVHALDFVPMSIPLTAVGYFSPFAQLSHAGGGIGLAADWSFFGEPDPTSFFMAPGLTHADIGGSVQPKRACPADIAHKIIKQVEYQFSDTNLIANDFLMKIMNKDAEGYVPMSVISSWKKVKAMGVTSQMLVKALRTSENLVISHDGKRVRRAQPFNDRHREELQSRMIIAENLPRDSTRNSLEKIFGTIGSVKNIRIRHPQEPSTAKSSKPDDIVCNKLHALIEYENAQQAEKAVDKLNDERNWRKGLRVRAVLRRPVSKTHQRADTTRPWGRGRGRPPATTAVPQHPGAAVVHSASQMSTRPQGPTMPDGTRGFAVGRGRPSLAAPRLAACTLIL